MRDEIKIKRGPKTMLPSLQLGEPALVTDEERLYIGGNNGNIPIPNKQDMDEVTTQLAQKANQLDVRLKSVKIEPEDLSDEILAGMTGQSTINLLSIPQNGSVSYEKTNFLTTGKNLFNKKNTIKNAYFAPDGSLVESSSYQISDWIPIKGGITYAINACRHYVLYNNNKDFLSFYSNNLSEPLTVTPTEDGYIRVSATNSKIEILQVEIGTSSTTYEEYRLELPYLSQPLQPKLETLESKVGNLEKAVSGAGGYLTVVKSGETFTITSAFDDTKDITIKTVRNGSNNGAFNLVSTTLGNDMIHDISDDITPIRTNISTIGGNHGYVNVVVVTMTNHGKTTSDLGSQWTDGTTTYTLLNISGDNLTFGCPYTVNANGVTESSRIVPIANLTHVSGATNTAIVDVSQITARQELFPSINNITTKYVIDGKEIIDDGTYVGNELQIKESYNIMDYKAIIDFAQSNIGKSYVNDDIDGIVRLSTTYIFTKGCNCLVSTNLKALNKVTIGDCGFVQSKIMSLANHTIKRYMPDVLPQDGYDFKNIVDMTNYNTNINFYPESFLDPSTPPNRCVDLMYDSSNNLKVGFTIGYLVDKTNSKNADRLVNTTKAWDMRSTKKIYPVAIKDLTLNVGDYKTFMAYRNYLSPEELGDATNINIVRDKKDTYVYLDFHISVSGYNVDLPDDIGKNITIVDSENFTLFNEVVDSDGITFSISNGYGNAILKLN